MSVPTVPLFDRLPEIYRTRDAEQAPADQLRAYLAAIEAAFGAVHDHISQLYEDLFIDTCDDWVIPYLADLLGTSHLKGEPRTLRARARHAALYLIVLSQRMESSGLPVSNSMAKPAPLRVLKAARATSRSALV